MALRFAARAAPDATTFLVHPDQTVKENKEETVTVRFEAGGLSEMCWHLITWGDSETVEQPAKLRGRLAAICEALAAWVEPLPDRPDRARLRPRGRRPPVLRRE